MSNLYLQTPDYVRFLEKTIQDQSTDIVAHTESIQALRQQLAAMTAERNALADQMDAIRRFPTEKAEWALYVQEVLAHNAGLAQENARLKAALERIRDMERWAFVLEPGYNPIPDLQDEIKDMKQIARATLESEAQS